MTKLFVENFWQAWHALSSLQISSRSYIRPGKTGALKNANDDLSHDVGRRSTLQSSSNASKYSERMPAQNLSATTAKNSVSARNEGNFLPADNARPVQAGNDRGWQTQVNGSRVNSIQSNVLPGSFSNRIVHTSQTKRYEENLAGCIDDDDDLFKVIHTIVSLQSN